MIYKNKFSPLNPWSCSKDYMEDHFFKNMKYFFDYLFIFEDPFCENYICIFHQKGFLNNYDYFYGRKNYQYPFYIVKLLLE